MGELWTEKSTVKDIEEEWTTDCGNFQSGFIIDRLQDMQAGIASTLHKLN